MMYGCDGINCNCKGLQKWDDLHWITSSIGLCDVCYKALYKNLPSDKIGDLEDQDDSESAKKLIEATI